MCVFFLDFGEIFLSFQTLNKQFIDIFINVSKFN